MEKIELLEATRKLLDLQTEKKEYNKEMNEKIKDVKAQIEMLVKE